MTLAKKSPSLGGRPPFPPDQVMQKTTMRFPPALMARVRQRLGDGQNFSELTRQLLADWLERQEANV